MYLNVENLLQTPAINHTQLTCANHQSWFSISAIPEHTICAHSRATPFLRLKHLNIFNEPESETWWKIISRAWLGDVLPLLAHGAPGDQSLLLHSDHLKRVAVAPFPRIFAR